MEKQTVYVYCDCGCNYMRNNITDEAKHLQGQFHSLWIKQSKTTPAPVVSARNKQVQCECTSTNKARHQKDRRHIQIVSDLQAINVEEQATEPSNRFENVNYGVNSLNSLNSLSELSELSELSIKGNTKLEKWESFASKYIIPAGVSKKFGDYFNNYDNKGVALHDIGFNAFIKTHRSGCAIVAWTSLSFSEQLEFYKQKARRLNKKQSELADIMNLQLPDNFEQMQGDINISASFFNEHSHKVFGDTENFLRENFPTIFLNKKFL